VPHTQEVIACLVDALLERHLFTRLLARRMDAQLDRTLTPDTSRVQAPRMHSACQGCTLRGEVMANASGGDAGVSISSLEASHVALRVSHRTKWSYVMSAFCETEERTFSIMQF
jgi:hypothetical protein